MNQVIIDNTLLVIALPSALFVSRQLRDRQAGLLFATFLLFPPVLVFLNMWAHTIAVAVVNVRRMQTGTFHYNFAVYSLFLFGIVFIVLSGFTIHFVNKYLRGNLKDRRTVFLLNLLTTVLFLPVGFINPIGFLPVLASIFSCILLLSDSRYRKRVHTHFSADETERVLANQYTLSV
jgi:hypothetical protein